MVCAGVSANPADPADISVYGFLLFGGHCDAVPADDTSVVRGGNLTASTAYTIATMMTDVTTIVTSAVSWVTTYTTSITDNKLILGFVIFGFVGTGLGLIKRMIRI